MLKNGEGTLQDEKLACEYFKQAIDKGHIDSLNGLFERRPRY